MIPSKQANIQQKTKQKEKKSRCCPLQVNTPNYLQWCGGTVERIVHKQVIANANQMGLNFFTKMSGLYCHIEHNYCKL